MTPRRLDLFMRTLLALAICALGAGARAPVAVAAEPGRFAFSLAEAVAPWVSFTAGGALMAPETARAGLAAESLRPVALLAVDLNADQAPDLVAGYAREGEGVLVVYLGIPGDEANPHPAVFAPFPHVYRLPVSPDLLGAGDLDADGTEDVVAARLGGTDLWLLRGDGAGSLGVPEARALPGAATAMAVGEVHRRDGLADVVVAVNGPDGTHVLIHQSAEGAWLASPEVLPLAGPARALALGLLDEDHLHDVVVGLGEELTIVQGRESTSEDPPLSVVSTYPLGFAPMALAVGNLLGDDAGAYEVAALGSDGGVRVARVADLGMGDGGRLVAQHVGPVGQTEASPLLLSARVSSLPADDLIAAGGSDRSVRILTADGRQAVDQAVVAPSEGMLASLGVGGAPVAIAVARLNADALDDLVMLVDGAPTPVVALSTPVHTFVVNTLSDLPDAAPGDGQCRTSAGFCSFRAAIEEANASSGADQIDFRLPQANRTIRPETILPEIRESVAIYGMGVPDPVGYVNIDGAQVAFEYSLPAGLRVNGKGSILSRLNVYNFSGDGISFASGLGSNGGHIVERCRIGTDQQGTSGLGNGGNGVLVQTQSGVALTHSVIGSNSRNGVLVFGGSGLEIQQANHIGVLPGAIATLPNGGDGVLVSSGRDHVIGRAGGISNIISGNTRHGVYLGQLASGVLVHNNRIGVGYDGTTAVGNRMYGVMIDRAASTTIGGSVARGNVIGGNLIGVFVDGAATSTSIIGNAIGVTSAGDATLPQIGYGIYLRSSAPASIRSNTIGGSGAHGILVTGEVDASTALCTVHDISGNWIGTSVAGIALGNRIAGIRVTGSSCAVIGANQVAHNQTGVHIEGSIPIVATVRGNTCAYNSEYGILVETDENLIEQNTLHGNTRAGILATGSSNRILRNTAFAEDSRPQTVGLDIRGHDNEIVGAENLATQVTGHSIGVLVSGDRNTVQSLDVSRNMGVGIEIRGDDNAIGGNSTQLVWLHHNDVGLLIASGASDNAVVGNHIGVTQTGAAGERYGTTGVIVRGDHNRFGGDGGQRNVVGGFDGAGLLVDGPSAHANQIVGNRIGLDVHGSPAPNWGGGIRIVGGASDNLMRGNWVAGNGSAGVSVVSGMGNRLASNRVHDNEGLGIDLGPSGVTHNDTGDGDSGANGLQNYPVVAAVTAGDDVRLQGSLASAPSTQYHLEFYLNDTCDASGYGEGAAPLTTTDVTTNGEGRASFDLTLAGVDVLGKHVSATATDPSGNTSEFSRCAEGRPASGGAPLVVDSVADAVDASTSDGVCATSASECTLRAAVQQANASVGPDTIIIPAGVYALSIAGLDDNAAAGDLDLTGDVTIVGAGADVTIVASAVADRVFQVLSGAQVTISGLTVRDGNIATTANGGGILVGGIGDTGAHLTLKSVSVQENRTGGSGGGIYAVGGLTIVSSAVVSNTATADGGGIALLAGTATLKNTTISANATRGSGGGIHNIGAAVSMNNVTVTGNSADTNVDGGNGGGLHNAGSVMALSNTIVAGNSDGSPGIYPYGEADCSGALTSQGYNLIGDRGKDRASGAVACSLEGGTGDSVGGFWLLQPAERYLTYSAGLGPLQANGATTPSQMPVASAAGWAVDWGNPAEPGGGNGACEAFDQRGQPRPLEGNTDGIAQCDRGAVEHVPSFLSIADVSIAEGEAATFSVSLSAPAQIAFLVDYETADGTARAGEDYAAASGVLSFGVGETLQTISVSSLHDTYNEENETLFVRLKNPQWVQIADGEGVATIVDGDPLPAVVAEDTSAGEGETAGVAIRLNSPSGRTVSVDYTLRPGTATADEDYVHGQGTLTFPSGVTTQQVAVVTVDDPLQEGNETLSLIVSNPVQASIGRSTGVITILDDDVPTLSIGHAARLEGHEGSSPMQFTVRLSRPSTQAVRVAYSTSPDTATAGVDYLPTTGVLEFPAGETFATLFVTIIGDRAVEPDETFTVTLTSPSGGATIGAATGIGTILDDDGGAARALYVPLVRRG